MPDLTIPVDHINAVVEALDANDDAVGIDHREGIALRVAKVGEESGEAMAALIAARGQNPLKPVGTIDALVGELFDVALTALVAAASLTGTWPGDFEAHVAAKTSRLVKAAPKSSPAGPVSAYGPAGDSHTGDAA